METVEIRHFHGFCGSGGGGKGFNRGHARVGNMIAKPRCIGGFDVNPISVKNFHRMTGTRATQLDAFNYEQYVRFHDKPPPPGWREATPEDVRKAAGGEVPHIVFLSSPCTGYSGLLPKDKSETCKYQALNALSVRGVWLLLEAWRDDPPELFVLENVPGLLTRGRFLVDQITALFHAHGYAVNESVHDCGELGHLGQSRKRCLIVARHLTKVPAMLYEPPRRPLRAVGDVLRHLPLPDDPAGGPMHRMPRLQFKTWLRLALVQPGSDWRSLSRFAIENGALRDYILVPEMRRDALGVRRWESPSGTITGNARPATGAFAVADPRPRLPMSQYQQYGVRRWEDTSGAITAQATPGGGAFSVADIRYGEPQLSKMFRIVRLGEGERVRAGSWAGTGAGADLPQDLPAPNERMAAIILSPEGAWHRPYSTYEVAAIQNFFDPEDPVERAAFSLEGTSDTCHRLEIGNGVPPSSAQAVANEMFRTILLARSGESFVLNDTPVWVRSMLAAIALPDCSPATSLVAA